MICCECYIWWREHAWRSLDECRQHLGLQYPHIAPRSALFDKPAREYHHTTHKESFVRRNKQSLLEPASSRADLFYRIAVGRKTSHGERLTIDHDPRLR